MRAGAGEQEGLSPVEEKGQRKNWVARASDSRSAPRGLLHGTARAGTRIPSRLVIARAAQETHPQRPCHQELSATCSSHREQKGDRSGTPSWLPQQVLATFPII